MFGRRRHAAATAATASPTPSPRLTDEQVFDIVESRIAEFLGEAGAWTVVRRSEADTDRIFQGVLTRAVAADVTTALQDARLAAEKDDLVSAHTAAPAPVEATTTGAPDAEPAALDWHPAPITVWADLKRPVTGEIPIAGPPLVA